MAVGFEQDGQSGTIKYNNVDILDVAEKVAQKGVNNGYAGLDNSGRLAQEAVKVQALGPTTTSGHIGVNAGKLQFGDGAQVRTVEQTSNKDQANGYVGTDAGNFLNRQRIPSFTGLLARDFDPPSQQYNQNSITTLKTYTAGDGSHIMITGIQLPARGQNLLKPRLLIKFHDNSSVFIENVGDGTLSDNFQGIANFLMGDAGGGSGAQNDGKRVVSVSFEVQNTDAVNPITQDLGTFRLRAYVVPAGGGTITVTPP